MNHQTYFAFKVLNNHVFCSSFFFTYHHQPNLRINYNKQLLQPFARTVSISYSYFISTVKLWNSLPSDIVVCTRVLKWSVPYLSLKCTSPKPFVHLASDPFILAYTIGIFVAVLFQIINIKNETKYFPLFSSDKNFCCYVQRLCFPTISLCLCLFYGGKINFHSGKNFQGGKNQFSTVEKSVSMVVSVNLHVGNVNFHSGKNQFPRVKNQFTRW